MTSGIRAFITMISNSYGRHEDGRVLADGWYQRLIELFKFFIS